MTTLPVSNIRYHSLDALRAFALLLGVVFHQAEAFRPGITMWPVKNETVHAFFGVFMHACHSFRLELFFIMAGFFAHLVLHRRGVWAFLQSRTKRIVGPLVLFWILLSPVLVYLWLWGFSAQGRLPELHIPAEYAAVPLWQLTLGYFMQFEFVKNFDLLHLWFLHQLGWIYVLVLSLRYLIIRLDTGLHFRQWVDGLLARCWRSSWNILILLIPTVGFLLMMDTWSVDTPRDSLLPHIPTTLLYGFMFSLGWFLHRREELLAEFTKRWRLHLVVGLIVIFPSVMVNRWMVEWGLGDFTLIRRAAYSVFYALMMWSWIFGMIGLFLHHCAAEKPAWRYLADSSYWVYIIHLPIVVLSQMLCAAWPIHFIVKFIVLNVITFGVCYWTYHYGVRSTWIGVMLNGRKYPFQPLWLKRGGWASVESSE